MSPDVEAIATSYVEAAEGDADRALRMAISDALADLTEAERRTLTCADFVGRLALVGSALPILHLNPSTGVPPR